MDQETFVIGSRRVRRIGFGVDHIDTAQYYGPDVANELIRAALHPYAGPRSWPSLPTRW